METTTIPQASATGKYTRLPALALYALLAAIPAQAVKKNDPDPDVVLKRINMSTQNDFGQIVSGEGDGSQASDVSGQFLQRTGVWLTQETTIKERLHLKIGVGGMFWYSLPEAKPGEDAIHKIRTKFGPGISQAQAVYHFGEVEKPAASLQMGLFPYKYNPDAQNLGEYLLRSMAYPNIIQTGGWNLLSSASYMVQGLRLSLPLWDGRFRSDFILPFERSLPPMNDLSPTYVAALTPFPGLEIGGGVSWSHGISVKPSRTSPRDRGFLQLDNPGNAFLKEVPNPDTVAYGPAPTIFIRDTSGYYTFKGFKVMGRLSLDPKAMLGGNGPFGPQDLKLYAEAALLGVKDYPVLYEKRSERIPVMVGFNIPTFGLLDVMAVEVEHFGSRFQNNMSQVYRNQIPIPQFVARFPSLDTIHGYDRNHPSLSDDDWKWSVYARKQVFGGLRVHAQVAADHMRPMDYELAPFWMPVTNRFGRDWYYLIRFELGI